MIELMPHSRPPRAERGTRRDARGISFLQHARSWKAVRVIDRAHDAVFGFQPDRKGRRVLYVVFGLVTLIGWLGFAAGYPMLSDRLTLLLWMIAAGSCFAAAYHVDSNGLWAVSGSAMLMACSWRTISLIWFEISGSYPELQSSTALIAVATSGWSMASIGIVAVWGSWLRPNQ
jgi:hypothetical protein